VVLERAGGVCEARFKGICSGTATDVHEIKTRARGGSYLDPVNCVALCRLCHTTITVQSSWAVRYGWVVNSWATDEDLAQAVLLRVAREWERD